MSDPVHDRRFNRERRIARRRNAESIAPPSTSFPPQDRLRGAIPLSMDRLWTVHQAAAFLGRSISWVYKAAERGELPRANGMAWGLRFLPADLMAYARGELRPASAVRSRRQGRT